MLARRSAAAFVAFAALGIVAACGDTAPGGSGDELEIGTEREAPLDEPCQWLSTAEASESMGRAGIETGSDIRTVTNAVAEGDELADCWYLPVDTQAGRLAVTLVSSEEAAANWRTNMEELATEEGHGATEHGQIQTLTRVADAPALQLSSPSGEPGSCDVHVLLGDASVVGVEVAADGAVESDAVCAEANAVLETVIGRLPEAG